MSVNFVADHNEYIYSDILITTTIDKRSSYFPIPNPGKVLPHVLDQALRSLKKYPSLVVKRGFFTLKHLKKP